MIREETQPFSWSLPSSLASIPLTSLALDLDFDVGEGEKMEEGQGGGKGEGDEVGEGKVWVYLFNDSVLFGVPTSSLLMQKIKVFIFLSSFFFLPIFFDKSKKYSPLKKGGWLLLAPISGSQRNLYRTNPRGKISSFFSHLPPSSLRKPSFETPRKP